MDKVTNDNKRFDELLRDTYYNPASPGSYSTAWALYSAAKLSEPNLTLKFTERWLQGQRVHQLHHPARKHFQRRKFRVRNIDEQWQADISYMVPLAPQNRGVKYLLYAIDVLSKYMWVEPLRDKRGVTTAAAFKAILARAAPRKPETLFTDNGSEFRAKEFRAVCEEYGIKQYMSTHDRVKAGIAERLVRTFMIALSKYIKAHGKRYLAALPLLESRYNNRCHRSIQARPAEVRADDPKSVNDAYNALYAEDKLREAATQKQNYKYPVGALVRTAISRVKTPFYKGYAQSWSDQVYAVASHLINEDQPAYRLSDRLTGNIIGRFYYQPELQRVYLDTPPQLKRPAEDAEEAVGADTARTIAKAVAKPLQAPVKPKTTRSGKVYGS